MSRRAVVDLFSGAGGASLGFKQLKGFDVRGAVDVDKTACEVYRENLDIAPLNGDLLELEFDDIRRHFGLSKDEVDVLVGCPPCQNFSSLRDTSPWPEGEPKDELLVAFVDLILRASPKVVLFENVPGILNTDNGKYVNWFRTWMKKAGYGVAMDVVNAADYGVPQARERTIAFCVHGAGDDQVSIPDPTHARPDKAKDNGKLPWKTVEDAIGDLPPLGAGDRCNEINGHRARNHQSTTLELIRAIPTDGGSRKDLPEDLELDCHKRLGDNSAGNVYGRMAWEDPAPTLTTRCTTPSCGRFIHPDQDRAISPREAARLMTFPDSFHLPEKNKYAERVIGNAVPPMLIETLVDQFFREHPNFV